MNSMPSERGLWDVLTTVNCCRPRQPVTMRSLRGYASHTRADGNNTIRAPRCVKGIIPADNLLPVI